ncbi:MAG: PKD domain-containing protein, partial [Saprospiraceae bacterium]
MYRFYTKAIVVLFLSFLIFPIFTSAQPSGFSNQLYMGNWNQVVGFTFDANGRMFAWEKSGKVWIVQNNTKTLMIDISEEVGDWRDFGLVGFTLDPNFLTNGYVYLFYVVDRHHLLNYGTTQYSATTNEYFNATIGRITRYTATSASNFAQVNYTSRKVLVGETKSTGMPILHESHGVGQLIFGTDGTLIASMGDGASYSSTDQGSAIETYYAQAISDGIITAAQNIGAYRSQSLDSYNGKLLRIDPATGNGLSTNPYYNSAAPQSPRSRIWASGLRNPYRITLRPGTGSTNPAAGNPGVIYIGDVGWGTREELDICTTAGQNFGWPKYEGMTYQPGYNNNTYLPTSHQLPKADWRSDNQPRASIGNTIYNIGSTQVPGPTFNGNSSTGGVWYTKTDFPASFRGYYHADYGGQWIRYFNMNASNEVVSVANFVDAAGACVFVGASPTQSGIFYVSYPSEIRRVISTANTNLPPIANATATPTYGTSPLTVQFTNTSSDPEGGALTYLWNFGDGTTTSTATNPSHIFTTAGTYNVTLTVTDNTGQTAIKNLSISVNNTPPNIAALSIDNVNSYPATAGAILQLSATVSDAQSPNSQLSYAWQITFYHDTHTHPEPIVYGQTTTGVLSYTPCNDGSTYYYRISLTVTDPGGLSATRYKNIYPDCNNAGNLPCYVGANGSLLREVWNNISGNATTNLTTNSAYPNSPTSTNQITTFQVPINIIDNYGTRIRGFIKPSVSGNYQFNISG